MQPKFDPDMITLRWFLEVYPTLTGWSKPYECTLQPGEVGHLRCLLFTAFQLALLRLGAVVSWDQLMLSRCLSKPHACTNFIVYSGSLYSWTNHVAFMVMFVFEQQKCSVLNYSSCSPQECLCCSCLTYIALSFYRIIALIMYPCHCKNSPKKASYLLLIHEHHMYIATAYS